MNISRRGILGSAVTVTALSAMAGARGASSQSAEDTLAEPARETPVADDVDVLICGGGPAGIAAAISAARSGASVRILEAHGCLGGVWTSGMLSYIMDANKPGLNAELIRRLEAMAARRSVEPQHYVYDVEAMKVLLEELCQTLNIRTQYHTRVVAVQKDENNRVRGVVTESKSGRQAWRARVVVDTTGDGDVGALAGCRFEVGRKEDCPCQPMSLMAIITASPEALRSVDTATSRGNKDKFLAIMKQAGVDPSYSKPTVWHMGGAVAAMMLNHQYNVKAFDAAAVTQATIQAVAKNYTKSPARCIGSAACGKRCRLVSTAEQIGVRDGRRIKGRYFVDVDDVTSGARHEDAICRSTFSVDIHALSAEQNKKSAYGTEGIHAKPFDIPLRALIAADVDGLMMAGRCISTTLHTPATASLETQSRWAKPPESPPLAAPAEKTTPDQIPWPSIAKRLAETRAIATRDASAS
ncbi:MAG: FAD-dependent oxidoreductase [Pirellulaceae bacterium]